MVQGQWLKLVISGVGVSLIMAWLFWPVVDNIIIVSWTLIFWLFVTVRVYLLYRYTRTPAAQRDDSGLVPGGENQTSYD